MVSQIPKLIPSYGRRKGRKLTPQRKELMREWAGVFIGHDSSPRWRGEVRRGVETDFRNSYPTPTPTLPRQRGRGEEVCLEIGFGSGEHIAAQALQNPEINFIGCETFIDGCGALVKKIAAEKIQNIRIWNEDARLLLSKLPADSIARAFILFPDPWPKKRHNKRRLINQETLEMLERVMKNGALLRIATDHPDYADWIITQIFAHGGFHWLAESKKDWEAAPTDHFTTRYQQKSLAGNMAFFLEFEKLATP